MSVEQIEMVIQRFDDMFNQPDLEIADEIFAPQSVAHFPLVPPLTRSAYKSFLQGFYDAFPDFRLEINDTIITRDRLVLRVTYFGTHEGNFMGIPASNCEVIMPAIKIFHLENNVIAEHWAELDVFGVIQQMSTMADCL